MKKKNMLRIGTMILIVLFLLLPMMSSPVAAEHTMYLGSVTTDNLPAGPAAGGTVNGGVPGTIVDTSPWNANYAVDFSHTENAGGIFGSKHVIKVNVIWTPPGKSQRSVTFTRTTNLPSTPPTTVSGTWTTPSITNYGGIGTIFQVTFEVHCEDLDNPGTIASWYSSTITYTIG